MSRCKHYPRLTFGYCTECERAGEVPGLNQCLHEDMLEYGKIVNKTPSKKVVQVRCTGCNMLGTVIEAWSDDEHDWVEIDESWHELGDYQKV